MLSNTAEEPATMPTGTGRRRSPVNDAPDGSRLAPVVAASVRPACRTDLDAIIDIDTRITGLRKPDYWRSQLDRCAAAAGGGPIFLVAILPGRPDISGFVLGEVRAWEFGSEPCGWVVAIGVDATTRLAGCGALLLAGLVRRFRERGVTKVRTMVARDNRLLLLFLRAAGLTTGPYLELARDIAAVPAADA